MLSLVFCCRDYFSTVAFLLQKKYQLLFDESDDKGITDLLKATTYPLSTTVERSSEAEKARVGSSDCMDDVRGTLPVIKTTAEVVNTTPEMPGEASYYRVAPREWD